MPKKLENVRELLLLEARRQAEENGYGAVTVRSVAKECGIGLGTVYNYFPSKDMLIASFILEDWEKSLSVMRYPFVMLMPPLVVR
jgi:AcrR family transcriptional regulator